MVKKQAKTKQIKIKKYKSAYIFFTQEKIQKYKKLYPNLLYRDIFKLIGEEWKNLKENSRKKYYDLEKQSKDIFEKNKEKSNYNYSIKKKKIKKPIRNRTPFMLYLHENKEKIDKNNCVLSLKKIGEMWKIYQIKKKKYILKNLMMIKKDIKKIYLNILKKRIKFKKAKPKIKN